MTEAEWLACEDPERILDFLRGKASNRKLRLSGCACCRRVEHLQRYPEFVHAVECAEQFADGNATDVELCIARKAALAAFDAQNASGLHLRPAESAASSMSEEDWPVSFGSPLHPIELTRRAARDACRAVARYSAHRVFPPLPELTYSEWPPTRAEFEAHAHANAEYDEREAAVDARLSAIEAVAQSVLIRDIFGNPFRPVAFPPEWHTDTAITLARQMYASRDFGAMPILADALQDAGCDCEDILSHCRGEGPHVRGCWIVDLVLGNE